MIENEGIRSITLNGQKVQYGWANAVTRRFKGPDLRVEVTSDTSKWSCTLEIPKKGETYLRIGANLFESDVYN